MSNDNQNAWSKCETLMLVAYLAAALLTNSYLRAYRWDDWRWEQVKGNGEIVYHTESSFFGTAAGTVAWPVYWTVRGCDYVVARLSSIEVSVKAERHGDE